MVQFTPKNTSCYSNRDFSLCKVAHHFRISMQSSCILHCERFQLKHTQRSHMLPLACSGLVSKQTLFREELNLFADLILLYITTTQQFYTEVDWLIKNCSIVLLVFRVHVFWFTILKIMALSLIYKTINCLHSLERFFSSWAV